MRKPKKEAPPAAKAALPQGWTKLGIQGDQKKSILTVIGSYSAKISALKDQMDQLKKDQYAEAFKLLTDAQKETLKKMAVDKVDPGKGKDDKIDDKKREIDLTPPFRSSGINRTGFLARSGACSNNFRSLKTSEVWNNRRGDLGTVI